MRSALLLVLVGCSSQSLGYLAPPPSTNQANGMAWIHDRLGSALQAEYVAKHVEPPVRLVPTDGSELALRGLAATVDIDGPSAHTELHFRFHNPEQRQREGRFTITLPPNAAVTRFTMKIAGEWREARIVARQKGREVYERFLHRKIDPALLEQDLGNVFSARVFPIEALEDKEIILAYDHPVSSARGYTLALDGLPRIGKLAIAIDNNGAKQTIARENELPSNIELAVARGSDAVAAGQAFVARIESAALIGDPAPLERVLYLVDTSASRAPVMGKQADVLRQLMYAQQGGLATVIAFDQTSVELFRGSAKDAERAVSGLYQHGALGASDLGAALARATTAGMSRVVIIGDGMATLGEHDATKLAAIVAGSRIERVDVVQVGTAVDRTTLLPIVGAGKQPGAVLDGTDPKTAAWQLAAAIVPPVAISVEGATQTWPATTKDVAPGEPVFVYGLRDGTRPLIAKVGDQRVVLAPRTGDADRLRRIVARAELAAMVEAHASAEAIEKHALAFQLVSSRTSMIVLETAADEQRFLDAPAPGIAVSPDSARNVPTGRTFQRVLASAAGAQADPYGASFSGSSSVENHYVVEGIATTGLASGESLLIISDYQNPNLMTGTKNVYADVMSPLALDIAAEQIWRNPGQLAKSRYHDSYEPPAPTYAKPYEGAYHDVMAAIARRDARVLERASAWQLASPGEVVAILALGEALEANGMGILAARAYGSIADLYPNRAELLRAAGERLDRVGARALAVDLYRRALRERPDQISTYRLLAWSLFRLNRPEEALAVLDQGIKQATWPSVQKTLLDDAAIVAANIVARHPERRYEMQYPIAVAPSLRFTLMWETDATNVDLLVTGGRGHFLEDMRDGFGPETFVVEQPGTYTLAAHYANKGAMGPAFGTTQIVRHDGKGGVIVEDRPFVIQTADGKVALGTVTR
jgi:Vault protein inter-alpha-trypsin domain